MLSQKTFAPDAAAADGDRGILVSAKKSGKNLQQQQQQQQQHRITTRGLVQNFQRIRT
jgi:hypothetical protein